MEKKSILLLVDDPGLERVISLLLRQASYQVISGDEAGGVIKKISYYSRSDTDFDALISCFENSGVDERKVISMVHSKYKPVPVLAIIPYGNERSEAELLKKKRDALILHSPFEPDELLACMEQIFAVVS